jgi:hypothetical protein
MMQDEVIATLIIDKNNFYQFYKSSVHVLKLESAYVIVIKK